MSRRFIGFSRPSAKFICIRIDDASSIVMTSGLVGVASLLAHVWELGMLAFIVRNFLKRFLSSLVGLR